VQAGREALSAVAVADKGEEDNSIDNILKETKKCYNRRKLNIGNSRKAA
jgi:hypothetical protein